MIKLKKLSHVKESEIPKVVQKRSGKNGGGSNSSKKSASITSRSNELGSVSCSPHGSVPPESTATVLNYFHNATVQGLFFMFFTYNIILECF